jgi:hypothetical protein
VACSRLVFLKHLLTWYAATVLQAPLAGPVDYAVTPSDAMVGVSRCCQVCPGVRRVRIVVCAPAHMSDCRDPCIGNAEMSLQLLQTVSSNAALAAPPPSLQLPVYTVQHWVHAGAGSGRTHRQGVPDVCRVHGPLPAPCVQVCVLQAQSLQVVLVGPRPGRLGGPHHTRCACVASMAMRSAHPAGCTKPHKPVAVICLIKSLHSARTAGMPPQFS